MERIQNSTKIVNNSKASVILVNKKTGVKSPNATKKAFVVVENPQLAFLRILKRCFPREVKRGGIHPTSVVSDGADIHPSVYIGPNCSIGKCKIKANTIIHSNVLINDNVTIGRNVIVYPYCLIGYEGLGHIENEKGMLENFPHYGGVVLGDYVEVFPFTNIDRGTLGNTRVGRCTKIDHYCHIGHNVTIGKNCIITAGTIIAGSAKIGDGVWISPNSSIRDYVVVGNNAFIGLGAVVMKNVPALPAGLASMALRAWSQIF
ncbi:MAG: UDP-3-O-(3-hydroxymyristoyl)glucosamine N-acyltransferase [Euryarchaeota archaeon]|nr:UDP-3-O-(3-hydroxymyristoyl)glucosamine N-acyltransferase [Euryarchaeota archaeon]